MSRHVDQSSNSFSSSQILAQSISMFYGATLHIQNFSVYMQSKLEYSSCVWDPHTKSNISKLEMGQRRAARYTCNRFHNTSSVTNMLTDIKWPHITTEKNTPHILLQNYISSSSVVAIYPTNLLVPSDSRTRQYTHSHSYRHIHTSLDSYKYSFYPKTIVQWNLLPAAAVQCPTLDSFKEEIPLSVLQQHI
jgi:hypothetical protein